MLGLYAESATTNIPLARLAFEPTIQMISTIELNGRFLG
jgi:hypothetical protein